MSEWPGKVITPNGRRIQVHAFKMEGTNRRGTTFIGLCGFSTWNIYLIKDSGIVTCHRCKNTDAYREATA